jgi:uncharacterized protein (DUF302 family)
MYIRPLVLLALLLPSLALAHGDLVKKPSQHEVAATIDRLEALVKDKGFTVFARIDHRAGAESVGKTLPDSQVLIFGKPEVGTQVMLHDMAAGLDLPLRVLAYSDLEGQTWVVYHNPQALKDSFGVENGKTLLDKMEGVLDKFTDAATQ